MHQSMFLSNLYQQDPDFACVMIQTLNIILLTSTELYDLRYKPLRVLDCADQILTILISKESR